MVGSIGGSPIWENPHIERSTPLLKAKLKNPPHVLESCSLEYASVSRLFSLTCTQKNEDNVRKRGSFSSVSSVSRVRPLTRNELIWGCIEGFAFLLQWLTLNPQPWPFCVCNYAIIGGCSAATIVEASPAVEF